MDLETKLKGMAKGKEEHKFFAGDVVRMKSETQKMTISAVFNNLADCLYLHNGSLVKVSFPTSVLVAAK